MIKLSNIPAAWAALNGRDSLKAETQRRIHDFLGYLPPEHKTPRRILQHLNNTLACDDLGGTAFCLWALSEGFANMDPIANRQLAVDEIYQDSYTDTNQDEAQKKEALQEARRWLKSVAKDPSIHMGEGKGFLVVGVKESSLVVKDTEDRLTDLLIPDYNILIEPYVRRKLLLTRLAKVDDGQKIDSEKLRNTNGFLYVKPLKGHFKKIAGVTYAKCWLQGYEDEKSGAFQNTKGRFLSERVKGRINELDLPSDVKKRGQNILDKVKTTRNSYAHDFQKLVEDPGWSSDEMAFEYFDVFEPVFRELVRKSYPEDNFGSSKKL